MNRRYCIYIKSPDSLSARSLTFRLMESGDVVLDEEVLMTRPSKRHKLQEKLIWDRLRGPRSSYRHGELSEEHINEAVAFFRGQINYIQVAAPRKP